MSRPCPLPIKGGNKWLLSGCSICSCKITRIHLIFLKMGFIPEVLARLHWMDSSWKRILSSWMKMALWGHPDLPEMSQKWDRNGPEDIFLHTISLSHLLVLGQQCWQNLAAKWLARAPSATELDASLNCCQLDKPWIVCVKSSNMKVFYKSKHLLLDVNVISSTVWKCCAVSLFHFFHFFHFKHKLSHLRSHLRLEDERVEFKEAPNKEAYCRPPVLSHLCVVMSFKVSEFQAQEAIIASKCSFRGGTQWTKIYGIEPGPWQLLFVASRTRSILLIHNLRMKLV